jgi:beta-phosphoglucomutase-like phosphatase (HAD superfamily)
LLLALRRLSIPVAVVTSSRNSAAVLEAAGLAGFLDTRVDGMDAAALRLPGKPAPDLFLEATRRLDRASDLPLLKISGIPGQTAWCRPNT